MTVVELLFAATVWFVLTVVVAIVADLVSEEARDRLDAVPYALLRLATRCLPVSQREDRLAEWTGELHEFLRGAEARPVPG